MKVVKAWRSPSGGLSIKMPILNSGAKWPMQDNEKAAAVHLDANQKRNKLMHEQVFIGLGSNEPNPAKGSPVEQIKAAIKVLAEQPDIEMVGASSLYVSTPMGPQNQDDFINAVAHVRCNCSADALLDILQSIEQQFGRQRKQERWGPRTLDLDILMFDQQIIQTKRLTIPHYGIAEREFVLVPLFELVPEMVMSDGRPISAWVANCSLKGLRRLRAEQPAQEQTA